MTEEQELQARSQRPRLFELDALRGLAAVSVVIFHYRLAFHSEDPGLVAILFGSGQQAVILFFVLSGYVLSLPYWSGRETPYPQFLLRRLCRIYLPYFVAAVLSILGALYFIHIQLPLTLWFRGTWHTPVTPGLVLSQFLMSPMPDFNTAFWSLRYEMQLSILFPVLIWLMRRCNPWVFTAAFGVLLNIKPYQLASALSWHYVDWTLRTAFLFALGATLARYSGPLRTAWLRLGRWQIAVFILSACLYYNLPVHLAHSHKGLEGKLVARANLIGGLGAAGILLCALHLPWMSRLLRHALPEYLGRISYSLYLVHGIVLFGLIDLLYGRIPGPWMMVIIAVSIFAAAHVFCISVEEPAMRLGKRLTRKKVPVAA